MSPQQNQTLRMLRMSGGATQVTAAEVFKIRRLPARINELRLMGYGIRRSMRHDAAGQRYAFYELIDRSQEIRA